ncbi:MAG: glycosyltransferase family 2 protein [Candidatus Gorgyraea atricola]|nr:glycosyltransferase family 2 protein [Candidatus Gorgyraea atricola]
MKKISVVTAVCNEAETVRDVYHVIKKVFAGLEKSYDYEHIFMDNCSTDETIFILKEIASQDRRVKILVYSKDFGPIKSGMMGYRYAVGDAVISYEANLKDPPELIPTFVKYWEDGYDVVYGVRKKTRDMFPMSFMRKTFYRIVNALSDEKLPLDAGGFRLVDRKIVNELLKLDDYKPYIRGLISSIGFKQIGVPYKRKARPKGVSKSSFKYLVDFAINAVISYSIVPIRLSTYIGLGLASLSFLACMIYLILKFTIWQAQIPAVAGVITLLLMFFGIQLFFLGVIGEYIGAIHSQVRKKPFVVIKEKINF